MSFEGTKPGLVHSEMSGHDKEEKETAGHRKPVPVWVDGSFDMLHIGHISALYQARALGDYLIVGAQPDADVVLHKGGPPVYPEAERYRLIQALQCVDQFAGAASYGTSVETLNKYGCEFCVHGDDDTLRVSETDAFNQLVKINRAKILERSESLQVKYGVAEGLSTDNDPDMHSEILRRAECGSTPTASLVQMILAGKIFQPAGRVVYVDGAFDLFNVGHLSFLEKAAQEGSCLLVGIHPDAIVSARKGPLFPILDMMDRALIVLSLKVPMRKGIFKVIDSGNKITSQTNVSRILGRRAEYVARNKVRIEKEKSAAKTLQKNSL
ncbi:hypothetical protein EGW08_021373 [Elysia chlorotica]|uniref:ethanolamine-phosphate cytidylyltransferase n=1 Tax=Elysia chlorotica TaxID=188477 RepID=A0A3S0Z730_ELYCH|nr:hypothetical protein EGW08_021373 [Elysia chlorotica]